MANFNLDTERMVRDAEKAAEEKLRSDLRVASNQIINELMGPANFYQKQEGPLRTLLRQRINEYTMTDEFAKIMDDAIREHMPAAIAHAAKSVTRHAAGRVAFANEWKSKE